MCRLASSAVRLIVVFGSVVTLNSKEYNALVWPHHAPHGGHEEKPMALRTVRNLSVEHLRKPVAAQLSP